MSQISSQQHQLEAALQDDGWQIVDRNTDVDWWADEVWTIESTWRPEGLQTFVTFLVDPMGDSANRKKGDGVWAVRFTALWPSTNNAEIIAEESLKHWDRKLDGLMAHLSRFRDSQVDD